MTGILNLLMGTVRSAGVTADPYFEYTTLLLPGSGTNGAQNNTFLDGSTNNFTITRNGNTTQGTFSPFSQTGWGNYFDGTGDNLVLPSSSNLAVGAGDFCIEAWVYWTATGVLDAIYSNLVNSAGGDTQLNVQLTTANKVQVTGWSTTFLTGATSVSSNTWNHIVVCRSGTTLSIFLNGTRDATTTSSNNWSSTNAFYIGDYPVGGSAFTGYISNLRVVKGSTPYDATSSTLTVPTAPLTAITNTQLLTCQSNRFRDASTNNFTITVNGNTSVVAFSPFNPTASWSAATYGGSGYFDGSGDYLTVADNTALEVPTQDFTIETWVYLTSLPSSGAGYTVIQKGRTGTSDFEYSFEIENNAGNMRLVCRTSSNGTSLTTANGNTISLAANTWYHVAVTRTTTTASFWFGGVAAGSGTVNSTTYTGAATVGLFANNAGSSPLVGYASNFRLVKGVAVYTGAFTPPTSPLTDAGSTSAASYPSTTNVNTSFASSATSLLLNFTNAGIYDATSKNDLETVGNAQISNAVTPQFGSTSIKFDGTGDYLFAPIYSSTNIPNTFFSPNGPFTVECWINPTTLTTRSIVGYSSTTSTIWVLQFNGSNKVAFKWVNTTPTLYTVTSTSSISTGVWTYVAATYDGSNIKIYVNGTLEATTATTGTLRTVSNVILGVGSWGGSIADPTFDGYIQDLRITNGIARTITASPTAAFPTL